MLGLLLGLAAAAATPTTAPPTHTVDPSAQRMPGLPQAKNGQIIDTYPIWNIEFVKTDRPIKFVFYPTLAALNEAFHKTHPNGGETQAFTDPWSSDTCTVNIVDPRVDYQPGVIGHEIMHCMFGTWHTPFGGPPPL